MFKFLKKNELRIRLARSSDQEAADVIPTNDIELDIFTKMFKETVKTVAIAAGCIMVASTVLSTISQIIVNSFDDN